VLVVHDTTSELERVIMNTLLFAGVENIDKLESILSAAHRVVVSSADCPIKDRFTSHGFENHKKNLNFRELIPKH
jgi:hypothetical protein